MGTFHSTKIFEISGPKLNGMGKVPGENFPKFRNTFSVHPLMEFPELSKLLCSICDRCRF